MLQIQSKRFYLDVKQNRRGRFIKVAEVFYNILKEFETRVRKSVREFVSSRANRVERRFFVLQIGADGRRSQIYLALSTASEFRNYLSTFSDFYASLGKPESSVAIAYKFR